MSTLYHAYDHLKDSGKGMWSDLFILVDTAVMVHEEEQRLREDDDREKKSFFYLFPRKKRSSLVKRQNPDRASLSLYPSSSSLDDYLKKKPQNPSFCDLPVVVYDADQLRAKKGKSKVDYDYRRGEMSGDDEKRLKNVTRFVRRNFDGSSSSCSTFLTENTTIIGKKRRLALLQQSKTGRQFKKAKVAASFTRRTNPEAPDWIFQVMTRMNADSQNHPRLIFERALTASDVASGQRRLLVPFQQLIRNDFLMPGESRAVDKEEYKDNEDENIGVGTILVNQKCEKWGLRFKLWAMENDTGHGTLNYALNWGWNDVVKGNHLQAGDKIGLWTFRCRGVLCFALEPY